MDGKSYLYVSDKLFSYLSAGKPTPFITYGSPGVRLYLKGTREAIEQADGMTPDQVIAMKRA